MHWKQKLLVKLWENKYMFTPNLESVMKQFHKTVSGLESLSTQNKQQAEKLDSMIDGLTTKRAELDVENRKIEDIKSTMSTLLNS
jgi:hypothetical protein